MGMDFLAVLVLVAATALCYRPLVLGEPPLSQDHNVHLYRAWETEPLIRSGRVWGWSDGEYAGSPPMLVYPFGGDLLVALVRGLTGANLARSYAWSVFLAEILIVLSAFLAARLHLSRAAGVLAGLLVLLDPGGFWIGGQEATMFVGLWETSVAAALVLSALARFGPASVRGTAGAFVPTGLLLGTAVLFTPLTLVMLAAAAVPWLLAHFSADPAPPLRVQAKGSAVAGLAAAAICAWWLLPFIVTRKYHNIGGVVPFSSSALWQGISEGGLLAAPPIWGGVALCGLLLLLARRDAFSRFIALFVPMALVLVIAESLRWIAHLLPDPSVIPSLMLPRLLSLTRLLCFVACGHALATLGGAAAASLAPRPGHWRDAAYCAFAGGIVVVLTVTARPKIPPFTHPAVPQDLSPTSRRALEQALDAAAPLVGKTHRIALYERGDGGYPTAMLGPTALRGMKVHLFPMTAHLDSGYAASVFSNRFFADEPQILARLDIVAVLSHGTPPAPLRGLPLLGRFGEYELRRLTPLPRAWLDGPGTATVLEWSDRSIRVRAAGIRGPEHLCLMLSCYEGWKQPDGAPVQPLEMVVQRETGAKARMSQVPARDGEMVLTYAGPAGRRAGLALSFACFDLLALALVLEGFPSRAQKGA